MIDLRVWRVIGGYQIAANLDIERAKANFSFRSIITGFLHLLLLIIIAFIKMVEENEVATASLHKQTNGIEYGEEEPVISASTSNQQVVITVILFICKSYSMKSEDTLEPKINPCWNLMLT